MPDKSVDLFLQDPPYNITACKWEWDIMEKIDEFWEQWCRVIKDNGAIVMTACQPFTSKLICSNLKMFKYEWIWDKHIPRNFVKAKYRPLSKHENVVVFGRGRINYYPIMVKRDKPRTCIQSGNSKTSESTPLTYHDGQPRTYTHRYPTTILTGCVMANNQKIHPTQKPISLMEYLIKTYTKEGDTVFDGFMGVGTTGVACNKLNRNFIGCELDKAYFKAAKILIKGYPKVK